MGGLSILLIALGAILAFAVNAAVDNVNLVALNQVWSVAPESNRDCHCLSVSLPLSVASPLACRVSKARAGLRA